MTWKEELCSYHLCETKDNKGQPRSTGTETGPLIGWRSYAHLQWEKELLLGIWSIWRLDIIFHALHDFFYLTIKTPILRWVSQFPNVYDISLMVNFFFFHFVKSLLHDKAKRTWKQLDMSSHSNQATSLLWALGNLFKFLGSHFLIYVMRIIILLIKLAW